MIYSALAQKTIDRLITTVQEPNKLNAGFDGMLTDLVVGMQLDRGLVWQVVITDLTVTHEYSTDGTISMVKTSLNSMESTQLTLGFLSQLDDNAGESLIQLHKSNTGNLEDWSPFLKFSEEYSSSILLPLRARGISPGFLSFQSKSQRTWSAEERSTLSKVREVVALLLGYEFEIVRLKQAADPSAKPGYIPAW